MCSTVVLTAGCASVFDARTDPYDRYRKRCEVVFVREWDGLRLSNSDFPTPLATPYDGTNALRDAYLSGYSRGVRWAIQVRGYGPLILCGATNDGRRADIQGWKDGRYAVELEAQKLRQRVHDELWEPFINDHYSRSDISFCLPRMPFLQPRWEDREYYPDGTLKSVHRGYYARGYRIYHGVTEQYYPSGQINWRSYFRHGEPHGVDLNWYPNGHLEQESPYYRGEEWHGVLRRWYENGQQECEEHWIHGKQDGTSTYWKEDGALDHVATYADGVLMKEEPQPPAGGDGKPATQP